MPVCSGEIQGLRLLRLSFRLYPAGPAFGGGGSVLVEEDIGGNRGAGVTL